MKQGSKCRARDTEQNGVQLDKFLMSGRPVRSGASLKVGFFYNRETRYFGEDEGRVWRPKGVYFYKVSDDF